MVVAVTVGVSLNKGGDDSDGNGEITSSVKAVKDVCAPTDYKKTCEDTLIKNGNNTSDPIELVKTAFKATMKQITDAAKKSQTMMELQKDPRTRMALDQCKELMDYALGELSNSFEELGKFEFHKLDEALINMRIWLSAAISHEETCLEGFQDTKGNAGETMKKALKTAIELTHNGLAIISEFLFRCEGDIWVPGKGVPYTPGLLAADPAAATTTPSGSDAPGFSSFGDTSGTGSISPAASPESSVEIVSKESSRTGSISPAASPESSLEIVSKDSSRAGSISPAGSPATSPESSVMMGSAERPGAGNISPAASPEISVMMSSTESSISMVSQST
ncbi:PREDICTED: probable pectinesterase/pectinesterase inhibitor 21 [Camelina sativa]|uniref:Probable pectinesterase/pectinesterase inhibitor 21 n=1 Tax=Camelina sativa TaxID=90675 RepID=A0ABM1RBD6_CAMSA|nr:PREDICTED: probable pectinesterase/pectinesterase inhibitor 21 [Camelina sativa]